MRRAIVEGRISAFGPEKMVDADLADMQWAKNTRSRAGSGLAASRASATASSAAGAAAGPPEVGGTYADWRTRREAAEAQSAELNLAELRGDLIRRADMERIVGELAAGLRESVLQIKGRLAPLLAAESDVMKVSAMLDAELRAALLKAAG